MLPPLITEVLVEKPTNKIVIISNVDNQQVTKRGDSQAVNEEEGGLADFDEMIDIDALYGLGLPYTFDAMTTEESGEQTTSQVPLVTEAIKTSNPAPAINDLPATTSDSAPAIEPVPNATPLLLMIKLRLLNMPHLLRMIQR